MSRGFVKEDDQEEAPFIPPRAALPQGAINYVTPAGFAQLLEERELLEQQLSTIQEINEKEKRIKRAVLTGKLQLLNERIGAARVLNPGDQPKNEVRFGALVSFKILSGDQQGAVREFQLVGVDEANIKENKIAFVAPIAVALSGKKRGEVAHFKRGSQIQEFEILDITYTS